MKLKHVAPLLVLSAATLAQAFPLVAFFDDQNEIVVRPNEGPFEILGGFDILSEGGNLVPAPDGFPFGPTAPSDQWFVLSNTPEQFTVGILGRTTIEQDFFTGVGYTGAPASGDLTVFYGNSDTIKPTEFPIQVGNELIIGSTVTSNGGTSNGDVPEDTPPPAEPTEPPPAEPEPPTVEPTEPPPAEPTEPPPVATDPPTPEPTPEPTPDAPVADDKSDEDGDGVMPVVDNSDMPGMDEMGDMAGMEDLTSGMNGDDGDSTNGVADPVAPADNPNGSPGGAGGAVPEPSTWAVWSVLGLIGAFVGWRRKRAVSE